MSQPTFIQANPGFFALEFVYDSSEDQDHYMEKHPVLAWKISDVEFHEDCVCTEAVIYNSHGIPTMNILRPDGTVTDGDAAWENIDEWRNEEILIRARSSKNN